MSKTFSFKPLLPLVLALMIDNMSFSAIYPLLTSMFQEHPTLFFSSHVTPRVADNYMSLAYLIMPLGMLFGCSFLGDLSDVWGRRKTMVLSMFGIGVGYFFMVISIFLASIWIFLLGRLITGLLAGSQPIAQAAIIDMSTPETKAVNMGYISFAVCIGFALGPVIAALFSSMTTEANVGFALPFIVIGFGAYISAIWLFTSFKPGEEASKIQIGKKVNPFRFIGIFVEGIKHRSIRILFPVIFFLGLGISLFFPIHCD